MCSPRCAKWSVQFHCHYFHQCPIPCKLVNHLVGCHSNQKPYHHWEKWCKCCCSHLPHHRTHHNQVRWIHPRDCMMFDHANHLRHGCAIHFLHPSQVPIQCRNHPNLGNMSRLLQQPTMN